MESAPTNRRRVETTTPFYDQKNFYEDNVRNVDPGYEYTIKEINQPTKKPIFNSNNWNRDRNYETMSTTRNIMHRIKNGTTISSLRNQETYIKNENQNRNLLNPTKRKTYNISNDSSYADNTYHKQETVYNARNYNDPIQTSTKKFYTTESNYKNENNKNINYNPTRIPVVQKRISQRKYEEYMKKIYDNMDSTQIQTRILANKFDGRDLAEPGQYPHMVAIGYRTTTNSIDWECGGSLIDEYFVITAAHCTELNGVKPLYVKIGDINLNFEDDSVVPQRLRIKNIYIYPSYHKNSYYNDIALIRLFSPAIFTEFVYPIRLWENQDIPYKKVFAMGYGATAFGKAKTNILTHLNLTLISNEECNRNMPKLSETNRGIIDSQICAVDMIADRDTCQGDSGGPLQLNMEGDKRIEYQLSGITSYGIGCGSSHPSVYTRISSYLDWLEKTVWPEDFI